MNLIHLWYLAIAFLFTGYFLLEGFDYGVGMLMMWRGKIRLKSDEDAEQFKRCLLNTIGPVWDGNEVWLITAIGGLFAAFPDWYASLLSAFYLPILAILLGLIARVVAIEWRGKIESNYWRVLADTGIALGSFLPPLMWGVIFTNCISGISLKNNNFQGSTLSLFSLQSVLGGLSTTILFLTYGAFFTILKTSGTVREHIRTLLPWLVVVTIVVLSSLNIILNIGHHRGAGPVGALIVSVVFLVLAVLAFYRQKDGWSFVSALLAVLSWSVSLFLNLNPVLIRSTSSAVNNIVIDQSSSSHYTLVVLSVCAVVAAPVVIGYQAWSYWVFRQRISSEAIPHSIGLSPWLSQQENSHLTKLMRK